MDNQELYRIHENALRRHRQVVGDLIKDTVQELHGSRLFEMAAADLLWRTGGTILLVAAAWEVYYEWKTGFEPKTQVELAYDTDPERLAEWIECMPGLPQLVREIEALEGDPRLNEWVEEMLDAFIDPLPPPPWATDAERRPKPLVEVMTNAWADDAWEQDSLAFDS